MDKTVDEILIEHFEGSKFTTEQELFDAIDLFVEDLVEDSYKWARRFKGDPRGNARSLDITVEEYDEEEE